MGTVTHTMAYYREKERIAYSAIPGMDQLLSSSPVEREKLEEEYPDAVFALMVADNLLGQDREQCEINQSAYLSILKGEDIADVRFRYDSAVRKYVERHLWDD